MSSGKEVKTESGRELKAGSVAQWALSSGLWFPVPTKNKTKMENNKMECDSIWKYVCWIKKRGSERDKTHCRYIMPDKEFSQRRNLVF